MMHVSKVNPLSVGKIGTCAKENEQECSAFSNVFAMETVAAMRTQDVDYWSSSFSLCVNVNEIMARPIAFPTVMYVLALLL